MGETSPDDERCTVFNIGGTKFFTCPRTLAGTKLLAMMSDRASDGEIFIDREPKMFDYILDFLRHKSMSRTLNLRNGEHGQHFFTILMEEAEVGSLNNIWL